MRKRSRLAILSLVMGTVIVAMVLSQRQREPSYDGHRLGWWMDRYANPLVGSYADHRDSENVLALSTIGTNAVPFLLGWIDFDGRPSRIRNAVASVLQHVPKAVRPAFLIEWSDVSAEYVRKCYRAQCAAAVFSVLGTNAQPFIPELQKLVITRSDDYRCVAAEWALFHLGTNGFAAMLNVLGTPNLPQRGELLQEFGWTHMIPTGEALASEADPDFRVNAVRAMPVVLKCLQDADPFVRGKAAGLLRVADADVVVPALTNFLAQQPPPPARRAATGVLAYRGQAAGAAVPFFLARLRDPDSEIRAEATNALLNISPAALTNALVQQ